mmetsp:Transcript_21559/g.51078  ORF Transcript_21559/g.51078 Transcript_21559/m.51078 type:complete len:371 (+) Transcript_21559:132-1244(+)
MWSTLVRPTATTRRTGCSRFASAKFAAAVRWLSLRLSVPISCCRAVGVGGWCRRRVVHGRQGHAGRWVVGHMPKLARVPEATPPWSATARRPPSELAHRHRLGLRGSCRIRRRGCGFRHGPGGNTLQLSARPWDIMLRLGPGSSTGDATHRLVGLSHGAWRRLIQRGILCPWRCGVGRWGILCRRRRGVGRWGVACLRVERVRWGVVWLSGGVVRSRRASVLCLGVCLSGSVVWRSAPGVRCLSVRWGVVCLVRVLCLCGVERSTRWDALCLRRRGGECLSGVVVLWLRVERVRWGVVCLSEGVVRTGNPRRIVHRPNACATRCRVGHLRIVTRVPRHSRVLTRVPLEHRTADGAFRALCWVRNIGKPLL